MEIRVEVDVRKIEAFWLLLTKCWYKNASVLCACSLKVTFFQVFLEHQAFNLLNGFAHSCK